MEILVVLYLFKIIVLKVFSVYDSDRLFVWDLKL